MANKKIPMRMCVGCAEMKSKNELIRVIKTPENEIVLDATGRKNGRGAYICSNMECLKKSENMMIDCIGNNQITDTEWLELMYNI